MQDPIKMSYSSMTEMASCETKYAHRKLWKSEIDSDIKQDDLALRLGGCFHELLEECMHKYHEATVDDCYACFGSYGIDDDQSRGLLFAMWGAYNLLHSASGLSVVACEEPIGDERVTGSIDAILKDNNGNWFICDLKTAASFSDVKFSRLNKDPQLNLYAYYRSQIAEKYNLDMDLFAGVIYRVTLKSRIKIKASEDAIDFGKRLLDSIEVKDVFIPFKDLDPDEAYLKIIQAQERAMQIRDHGAEPEKNYASCEAWFRPCNYFSKCHGHLNTDGGKLYPPRTHWNMFPYVENKTDKELEDLGL